MRQTSKKTQYFDNQPSWKYINFQNAMISAVLHGHFQTEAGGVRRSLDELPDYLEQIGVGDGPTVIRPFGNPPEKEAKYLARAFDKAIRDSRWFEPDEGKTTTPSSLTLRCYLQEIDVLNRKVQS